jgi:hypothetical protein
MQKHNTDDYVRQSTETEFMCNFEELLGRMEKRRNDVWVGILE